MFSYLFVACDRLPAKNVSAVIKINSLLGITCLLHIFDITASAHDMLKVMTTHLLGQLTA